MGQFSELMSLPVGARPWSVDLHVHTPASNDTDKKWMGLAPADLVELALRAHLEVIAVTDHNSVDWCDKLRTAASEAQLRVLPGVEISTSEGHLLAIFEPDKPASEIKELLVRVGIRERDFGNLEVIADRSITDVATQVSNDGGVAIAAHVDRAKGFWKLTATGARRKQIYACPDIRALEIAGMELRTKFESGAASGYRRKATCVQGSDSYFPGGTMHQADAIGQRRTYLSMGEVSIAGLKQALLDREARVRLEEDSRPNPQAVIEGMWVSSGFLSGQKLRFSENITCLIGGTGSGKSLSIELIRFALGQQVNGKVLARLAAEVQRLLAFGLGPLATVTVVVRKGDKYYLVERTWSTNSGTPTVSYVQNGVPIPAQPPIEVPTFFPIRAFSQSEIIEYAREPLARLSLLDDLIDIDIERTSISSTKSALRRNAAELIEAATNLKAAETRAAELPGVTEEVNRLSALVQHPSVRQHQAWLAEQSELDRAKNSLGDLATTVETEWPALDGPLVRTGRLGDKSPSRILLRTLVQVEEAVQRAIGESRSALADAVKEAQLEVEAVRAKWATKFTVADQKYRSVVAGLDPAIRSQAALNSNLAKLKERQDALASVRDEISTVHEPGIARLQDQREKLLDNLQRERRSIRNKRARKADDLTQTLERQVVIRLRDAAHADEFLASLIDLRTGSHIQESDLKSLADKVHPVPFVKGLVSLDYGKLASAANVSADTLRKFHENIVERGRLSDLYGTQLIDVEDIVRIQFAIEGQDYRDLEDLAHGQKCTVVLMIALAEGDFPLLVDQPEDALHAPWIEGYIVSALRRRRGYRQNVFATRSANVLVSADAEQVIALKADAVSSKVLETGSLDQFQTRDLVMYHVEGGEVPFNRRQDKYAASRRVSPHVRT
jgi:DNA repair ATPase RecN